MERFVYEDYEDFICHFVSAFEGFETDDDFRDFTIVAKYNAARTILSELIKFDYPIIRIDIEPNGLDYYNREYYINLSDEGVWCEKAYNVDAETYLGDEPCVAFVLDDCNSKIVSSIGCDLICEVGIGEDDCECDGDYAHCDCNHEIIEYTEEDDDVKGFTISGHDDNSSWSKSFYSTDLDLVHRMLEFWS